MKFLNSIDGANKVLTDANNRFVSDTEKAAWNAKETPSGAQGKVDTHALVAATQDGLGHIKLSDLPSGGGGGGTKTCRFVIGTSAAGWTSDDCDYLCDGTTDQIEINQAISALPASGGEVLILDGTYNITAKINVNKNNVSIKGNGSATVLKRMYNSGSAEGVITLTGVEGCRVENLQIDGNRSNYSNSNNRNIRLSSSDNCVVTGTIHRTSNNYGIELNSSSNNLITNNTCENSYYYGIYLDNRSSDNVVSGNTCSGNDTGICLTGNSGNNAVTNNICSNCDSCGLILGTAANKGNTVANNICNENGLYGIDISSSYDSMVTGNTVKNNSFHGIVLTAAKNNIIANNVCYDNNRTAIALSSNCERNTVIGNTCIRGAGSMNDYATNQDTITVGTYNNHYNLISSNYCLGKAVVINGGTSNTEINNKYE